MGVHKHRAAALLKAAEALEQHERLVRQVATSRAEVEAAVKEADKYFKPSIIGNVLGKHASWVAARRDGKRWPRLDRERYGASS